MFRLILLTWVLIKVSSTERELHHQSDVNYTVTSNNSHHNYYERFVDWGLNMFSPRSYVSSCSNNNEEFSPLHLHEPFEKVNGNHFKQYSNLSSGFLHRSNVNTLYNSNVNNDIVKSGQSKIYSDEHGMYDKKLVDYDVNFVNQLQVVTKNHIENKKRKSIVVVTVDPISSRTSIDSFTKRKERFELMDPVSFIRSTRTPLTNGYEESNSNRLFGQKLYTKRSREQYDYQEASVDSPKILTTAGTIKKFFLSSLRRKWANVTGHNVLKGQRVTNGLQSASITSKVRQDKKHAIKYNNQEKLRVSVSRSSKKGAKLVNTYATGCSENVKQTRDYEEITGDPVTESQACSAEGKNKHIDAITAIRKKSYVAKNISNKKNDGLRNPEESSLDNWHNVSPGSTTNDNLSSCISVSVSNKYKTNDDSEKSLELSDMHIIGGSKYSKIVIRTQNDSASDLALTHTKTNESNEEMVKYSANNNKDSNISRKQSAKATIHSDLKNKSNYTVINNLSKYTKEINLFNEPTKSYDNYIFPKKYTINSTKWVSSYGRGSHNFNFSFKPTMLSPKKYMDYLSTKKSLLSTLNNVLVTQKYNEILRTKSNRPKPLSHFPDKEDLAGRQHAYVNNTVQLSGINFKLIANSGKITKSINELSPTELNSSSGPMTADGNIAGLSGNLMKGNVEVENLAIRKLFDKKESPTSVLSKFKEKQQVHATEAIDATKDEVDVSNYNSTNNNVTNYSSSNNSSNNVTNTLNNNDNLNNNNSNNNFNTSNSTFAGASLWTVRSSGVSISSNGNDETVSASPEIAIDVAGTAGLMKTKGVTAVFSDAGDLLSASDISIMARLSSAAEQVLTECQNLNANTESDNLTLASQTTTEGLTLETDSLSTECQATDIHSKEGDVLSQSQTPEFPKTESDSLVSDYQTAEIVKTQSDLFLPANQTTTEYFTVESHTKEFFTTESDFLSESQKTTRFLYTERGISPFASNSFQDGDTEGVTVADRKTPQYHNSKSDEFLPYPSSTKLDKFSQYHHSTKLDEFSPQHHSTKFQDEFSSHFNTELEDEVSTQRHSTKFKGGFSSHFNNELEDELSAHHRTKLGDEFISHRNTKLEGELSAHHTTKSENEISSHHNTKSKDDVWSHHPTTKLENELSSRHSTKSEDDFSSHHSTKSEDDFSSHHSTKLGDDFSSRHSTKLDDKFSSHQLDAHREATTFLVTEHETTVRGATAEIEGITTECLTHSQTEQAFSANSETAAVREADHLSDNPKLNELDVDGSSNAHPLGNTTNVRSSTLHILSIVPHDREQTALTDISMAHADNTSNSDFSVSHTSNPKTQHVFATIHATNRMREKYSTAYPTYNTENALSVMQLNKKQTTKRKNLVKKVLDIIHP